MMAVKIKTETERQAEETHKQCKTCKKMLPLSKFANNTTDQRLSNCRKCAAKKAKLKDASVFQDASAAREMIVMFDPDRSEFIVCEVVSKKVVSKTADYIREFYQSKGIRVINVTRKV